MTSWFVTYLAYEVKQKFPRELIISFRSLDTPTKIADIYTNFPISVSTFNIKSTYRLEKTLEDILPAPLNTKKVFLPPNFKNLDLKRYTRRLKTLYDVEVEFNPERYCDFFIIQATLPNDPDTLEKLPSTKINGFQLGNYTKTTVRSLNILSRAVSLDERLEKAFIMKDEIMDAESHIIYLINKIPKEDKPHLVRKQLFEFFSTYQEFNLENILTLAEKNRLKHLIKYLTQNNAEKILDLHRKITDNIPQLDKLVKEVDESNKIVADTENFIYKIHLQYSPENITPLNNLGVKGVTFHEHLYKELNQQRVAFFDIEKPLWKRKHEKILLDRREKLLKLKGLSKYNNQYDQERISNLIGQIEEKLVYEVKDIKVPLFQEAYDARVSNIALLVRNEDGSLIRQYHKISYNSSEERSINGYETFNYPDERSLVNEFFYQLKKIKPFSFRNHNFPYDLIQTREAFLEAKLGKKFDLSTEAQNPRRDVVKKVYQRTIAPGQEIQDTYRGSFNAFPYLKSRFGSSHKLEDVTRFVRGLRKIEREFKKTVTHEQLRDLMLLTMHGDKEAESDLDTYAISDVEEPLRDVSDYELFNDMVLKIKRFMPHVSITKIMFSPTIMEELHKTIHFSKYHNERYFGHEEKVREDEKEIFDKRYLILRRELLKRNKVNIVNYKAERDVVQVYTPIELWMKDFLISVFPLWETYFNELSGNPVERIAMLQYPKYFLKDPLIDAYFYTKEKGLYKNGLIKLGLIKEDTKKLFSELEQRIIRLNEGKLLASYENSLYHLRDHYRSIDMKLPAHVRKSIRLKPMHLYLEQEEQLEISGLETNLFMYDNLDLIKIKNFPLTLTRFLNDELKTLFRRFNSTFNTFMGISHDLESLVNDETQHLFKGKGNFPYLLNQRRRIISRMKKFRLFYGQSVDDFDAMLNNAFSNLAKELITNNIQLIELQRDYLFVKGNLPRDSMLIPIRNIPNYIKIETKEDKDDEPNLFEMQLNTRA